MKVSTILDHIDSGHMALPEFQRGYVWNRDQVRGLMQSLYRRHPVGSLLVWATQSEGAASRGDGPLAQGVVKLLLDGQQRVTSLYGIIRGRPPKFFDGNAGAFADLRFNVDTEEFAFYSPVKMGEDPLWVDLTELMKGGNDGLGRYIAKLGAVPAIAPKLGGYIGRLSQVLGVRDVDFHIDEVTGADKTIDVVVDIFNRVNSGGTKLSKGDLALAKICAEAPVARERMKNALKRWRDSGYYFDLDWLLRNVNTVATGEAKFHHLHTITAPAFSAALERTERSIDSLLNLIGGRLGLDHDRVLFGKYALPVMAHYLDRRGGTLTALDEKERDKLLFWYVNASIWGRFSGATESVIDRDLELLADLPTGLAKLIAELQLWHGGLTIQPGNFGGWSLGARFYPMLYLLTRVPVHDDWRQTRRCATFRRERPDAMTAAETVAWVKPPEPIRGLDHLGVQAPCIALYGQLLPGITNVTDRARYYAFHPWVLWSFERRYTDHSVDEFRRVLRRAECLFALIAIRHARIVGDGDDGLHGRAMVGRDKLLRIGVNAQSFALGDYATLEGPNRYFKNKLGGLGQYYFGPLRDLRVLDHHEGAGYPGYDEERGRPLAEAFASGVPEDSFFRVLEQQATTWEELDELEAFCPCKLRENAVEHELLLDLFLARTEPFRGDGGTTRRASLGLMLDLVSQPARDADYVFEGVLRGAAYTGALVDGSAWQVTEAHQRVLRGWGTYQRNELLSIAVQGLFAAALRAIERDEAGRIRKASDAADVAVRLLAALDADLKLPLDALVSRVRGTLPVLADWQNESHELQRGWRLQNLPLKDDASLEEIARESVAILLALLARGVDEYPYGDFELDPEYFDPREVHLLSLRHASKNEWAGLTVEDWVQWVAVQWGVARHLRVALRKLRGERRDTFRIRPLEGELRVVEAPEPVFTQPRVSRAQQILRDLGLVEYDDEGVMVLTDRGRAELEACRAG